MNRLRIVFVVLTIIFVSRTSFACENEAGVLNSLHIPVGLTASVGLATAGYLVDGIRFTATGMFLPIVMLASDRKGKEILVSYWAWESTESWRCPL